MWRLRAVVVPLLGAAALALAGAGLWTLVAGGPFRQRAAVALLVLGTVIAVSGGNMLPRMTSNDALGFGIQRSLAAEDARTDRGAGDLTGTGLGLLVGLPLALIGGLLLS
jgi:hypothetical protein